MENGGYVQDGAVKGRPSPSAVIHAHGLGETTESPQAKVLSNAIWNVVTGLSGAIVSVAVPPFLTRELSHEAYGAWALALQIGTYINLFGFGLQIAVGRYVAHSAARNDKAALDGYVATAFWFLVAASTVGFACICALAATLHGLLPQLSSEILIQTQIAVVLVGFAFSITLLGTIFSAVFTGLQRSRVPAVIQLGGRVMLTLGLIAGAFTHNLAILAATYAVISMLIAITLWWSWRSRTVAPSVAFRKISRTYGKELFGFCLSLSVWNISMLLVSGLDLLIVGHWDFSQTSYYAVGITLSTFVASVLTALCNALIPATAASIADGSANAALAMLRRGLNLISAISVLAAAPLIFAGYLVLKLWVGAQYAAQSATIVAILAAAGVIRTLLLPYVTVAIGTGEQRKMILTPVIEGGCSLILSVFLAQRFGAIGVAGAKVIGALIGLSLLIAQNALAKVMSLLTRRELFRIAILRPAAVWSLLTLSYITVTWFSLGLLETAIIMGILTLLCVWKILLTSEDKISAQEMAGNMLAKMRAINFH